MQWDWREDVVQKLRTDWALHPSVEVLHSGVLRKKYFLPHSWSSSNFIHLNVFSASDLATFPLHPPDVLLPHIPKYSFPSVRSPCTTLRFSLLPTHFSPALLLKTPIWPSKSLPLTSLPISVISSQSIPLFHLQFQWCLCRSVHSDSTHTR